MQTKVLFQAFDINFLVNIFPIKLKEKKTNLFFRKNKSTDAYYEEMETRCFLNIIFLIAMPFMGPS